MARQEEGATEDQTADAGGGVNRRPRIVNSRKRGIPFVALFGMEGAQRNIELALKDEKTPAALKAELLRYQQNPFKAAAEDQEKLLNEADQRAEQADQSAATYRKGRSTGAGREEEQGRREAIRKLGEKYPDLTAGRLYDHVDAWRIRQEEISKSTFANILSKVAPRRKKSR